MTLIELLGLPIALAIVLLLVLMPFLGAKAAWDAAGTISLALSVTWFTGLCVRQALFNRLPKCQCGTNAIRATSVSEHGTDLECAACGRRYEFSSVQSDGWRRCKRLDASSPPRPWKKRRVWGFWIDDG